MRYGNFIIQKSFTSLASTLDMAIRNSSFNPNIKNLIHAKQILLIIYILNIQYLISSVEKITFLYFLNQNSRTFMLLSLIILYLHYFFLNKRLFTEKDEELLKERIEKAVYSDKINIVNNQFKEKDTLILTFDELVKTTFHKPYTIEWKLWERATSLKGSADVTFNFIYLKWSDIVKAYTQYVTERQSDSIELISINPNSLIFIQELDWINWSNNIFMIPTKVTIYQGYDFKRDLKWIIPALRAGIAWKTVEEARKIILQYPEISSVKMNLWLFQGNVLPNVKSRIKVKVEY